ncbi:hypothetical protein ACHAWF_015167, partial [Thalassiosira exigua]
MSVAELAGTGVVMGVIHVLTGPDHLSALATLSGSDLSSRKADMCAFLLGVRWGLGHSLGLIVVGGALISLEEAGSDWIHMNEALSTTLEGLVGVFMLCLGFYGLNRALNNRAGRGRGRLSNSMKSLQLKEQGKQEGGNSPKRGGDSPKTAGGMPIEDRRRSMEIIGQMADVLNRDGDAMRSLSPDNDDDSEDIESRIYNAVESLRQNSDHTDEGAKSMDNEQFMSTLTSSAHGALSRSFVNILNTKPSPMKATAVVKKHAAPENSIRKEPLPDLSAPSRWGRCSDLFCTPGVLALAAGLVHGVAGPGGVLGVIPAVQLRDARLATVYLGTFCLTSTVVMGCFAATYGRFSEWLAGDVR